MSDSDCQIPANSDISGIGIRVAIYITSFSVSLLPPRKRDRDALDKLRNTLLQASVLNGLALLIAGVVQTASRQLDLYHAIVIAQKLNLLIFAAIPAFSHRGTSAQYYFYFWIMWSIFTLTQSWLLYVWATTPTFGLSLVNTELRNCNDSVKYFILFIEVRATVPWLRRLMLAWLGMQTLSLLICLFGRPWVPSPSGSELGGDNDNHFPRNSELGKFMYRAIRIVRVLVFMYGIVTLELIVKHNNVQPAEDDWSFGQIVTIVISIGGLLGIVDLVLGDP